MQRDEDFQASEKLQKFQPVIDQYKKYKAGFINDTIDINIFDRHPLVYERTTALQVVRIYFSTPTFDRITKDEKANFEEKLSVIGGTMGLLTGFSLISGVEIIYFLLKIAANIIRKKQMIFLIYAII